MADQPQKRAPRFSRSKTSPSRIRQTENEQVSLDPTEIDGLITDFYENKIQLQELVRKEKRLKALIHRLLDITNSNIIKGHALELTRKTQQRRIITRSDVPSDVFNQYSRQIEIQMLHIGALARPITPG
jgi:predicted O-linked N-acetylglucosamine transferase (SPINDLY family)